MPGTVPAVTADVVAPQLRDAPDMLNSGLGALRQMLTVELSPAQANRSWIDTDKGRTRDASGAPRGLGRTGAPSPRQRDREPDAAGAAEVRQLVADHFKSGRYRLEMSTAEVLDVDREERSPEGNPEAMVCDKLTNVTLLKAVKQLNPDQQECIVLRFLQGFSVAETARAMQKNEGAIKALQYRAVRTLARLLPDGFSR